MERFLPAAWFIGFGLWFGVRDHPLEVPTVAAIAAGLALLLRAAARTAW